jgi:hypothetical protein
MSVEKQIPQMYDVNMYSNKLSATVGGNGSTSPQELRERIRMLSNEMEKRERAAITEGITRDKVAAEKKMNEKTDKYGLSNEAYNANNYIRKELEQEVSNAISVSAMLKREIRKRQILHLTSNYYAQFRNFLTRVMIITLGTTSLLALVVAGWRDVQMPTQVFVSISVIMRMFADNTMRRSIQWNRFYWNDVIDIDKAIEEKKEKEKQKQKMRENICDSSYT